MLTKLLSSFVAFSSQRAYFWKLQAITAHLTHLEIAIDNFGAFRARRNLPFRPFRLVSGVLRLALGVALLVAASTNHGPSTT